MKEVTGEAFAKFLDWLDHDPESAGRKYQEIHRRLAGIFARWDCPAPEDLADQTLDRVVLKADVIREGYHGDPFAYIYGVARNVRREDQRARGTAQKRLAAGAPPAEDPEERATTERKLGCLESCFTRTFTPEEAHLLLDYYRERRGVSASRELLARTAGLSATSLRKRTQRYRQRLEECLRHCLGWQEQRHKTAPGHIEGWGQ